MSAWSEYKARLGEARPWHYVNPNNYVAEEVSAHRMDICLSCDKLIQITKQCKECGCFMSAKTKLQNATCPLGKW
jgi:hypothetical protein